MTPLSNAELVDSFIAAFDAGDTERVAQLLANDARTNNTGPDQIFHDLHRWSPWTSLHRADLDGEPVAVIWVPEEQSDQHPANDPQPVGYISFDIADGSITRTTIHDSLPDGLDTKPEPGTLVTTEPGIDGFVKDANAPAG